MTTTIKIELKANMTDKKSSFVTLTIPDEVFEANKSGFESLVGYYVFSATTRPSDEYLKAKWRESVANDETLKSFEEWIKSDN